VTRFRSLEHARQVVADFIGRYNREWLLERHGYMTPAEVRESFIQMAA
jgi:transposase InsO family protein